LAFSQCAADVGADVSESVASSGGARNNDASTATGPIETDPTVTATGLIFDPSGTAQTQLRNGAANKRTLIHGSGFGGVVGRQGGLQVHRSAYGTRGTLGVREAL
jgi:hypothetical protein